MVEKKEPPFLDLVNYVLTIIDSLLGAMGIWRKIIFRYLIPMLSFYFPVQYFIVGEILHNDPYVNMALIYLVDIGAFVLLFVLISLQKTVASIVEFIFCMLFLLDGGLRLIDISSVLNIEYMQIGLGLSLFVVVMKFFAGVYVLLKKYRRKHMKKKKHHTHEKKRTAIMLEEEEKWILQSAPNKNDEKDDNATSPIDKVGFILENREKQKVIGRPESQGFITTRLNEDDNQK